MWYPAAKILDDYEPQGDSSIFGFLQEQKSKVVKNDKMQFWYSDEISEPKNDKYSKYDDFLETLENDIEIEKCKKFEEKPKSDVLLNYLMANSSP